MKTNLSPPLALLASFLPFSACLAALPERSQVVQAESMTLDGEGWTVREHSPDAWYASRPVGQMLGGQNNKPGAAAATFQISAAGKYRIWVRYLDMVNYRSKSGFRLSGTQQGKRVAQKEFDHTEASPRSSPEGEQKWGDGFARWIWDFVEFDAAPGPLQVAVEKIHLTSVHGCTRTLDLLLLCDDPAYEPAVTDLTPLYVKVRMLPEQKEPVVIHFWGRRPFSPWYTPHANINQKGIFLGVGTGSEDKPGVRMAAGQESVWVDVAPYLAYGGLNRISLYAMRSYHEPESEAYFELSFSETPSEAGLIKKAERKGAGDGFIIAVDLVDYRLITETEGSQASLEMAKATPAVAGKLPTEFPFFTGMSLSEQRSTAQAVAHEREALQRIGIGSSKIRPSNFFFHLTKSPGCLSQPDRTRIDESMKELADKNQDRTGWTMINLMDEPGFGFDHVESCPACQQGFAPYLKRLGLADSEIAKLKINNDPEGASADEKASYYYTRRYMNHLMTEMHRAGTESVQTHLPGISTTANFACELLEGNLVSRCVDWYEIYATGALTFGWNEDWGGWARTRQVNGYYVDVMRSACRKPGLNFGIYFRDNPGRSEYEMRRLKELDVFDGIKLFCGAQTPRRQTFPAGKGRVIVVGFFPAISYIATSQRAEGADHSTLDFEAAHRDWMQKVLTQGKLQPRLRTDNYRVEANLIQSCDADIIALSNWTGQEQTITLELDDAPAYRQVSSVTGKILSKETKDGTLRLQVTFAAGDFIQLKR